MRISSAVGLRGKFFYKMKSPQIYCFAFESFLLTFWAIFKSFSSAVNKQIVLITVIVSRDVKRRGERGTMLQASNRRGVQSNVASTSFNAGLYSQKTLGCSKMGAPNLFRAPDAI